MVLSLLFINKVKFITNTRHNKVECKARRSSVVLRFKELVLCTLITSVFRALLSNLKMSQLQLVFGILAHLFSINNTSYYFVK